MRYTFNLKKAYDDYYLYSHNTVYGKGERPRSEYVSPYKENRYIPEHNITKRMCYNKLGQYEDIDESPEHLAKIKKALEIIKEKPQATLWLIQHCDKEMEYDDMLFLFKEDVTKEQFDLLKEELL